MNMVSLSVTLIIGSAVCLSVNASGGCSTNSCNQETQVCVPTEDGENSVCVTCWPGSQPSDDDSDDSDCEDINECADDNAGCSHFCLNSVGSFSCLCPLGARLSVDKKTCVCDPGLQFGTDGRFCQDIDECWEGTDNCQWGCVNTIGAWRCTCPPYSRLSDDGRSCECQAGMATDETLSTLSCYDVDECAAGDKPCGDNKACANAEGSFACYTCPSGSHVSEDGTFCEPDLTAQASPMSRKGKKKNKASKGNRGSHSKENSSSSRGSRSD